MTKKITLLLILAVATLIMAAVAIPLLKSDGLETLTGNEKIFGESALLNAGDVLHNPMQRLIILKIKVRQVASQESDKYCDIGFMKPIRVLGDYSATADVYTFFGIRYASVITGCGGGASINYY